MSVSGLKVTFQASRVREDLPPYSSNFGGVTRTDADGRFTFDGLNEGTINIFASDSEIGFLDRLDVPWTYRAARDVELKSGWTKAALIELIRGVEVKGKVLASTGQPLKGANIGVHGPLRPRSGAAVVSTTTDAEGHYDYRLPPGETYVLRDGPSARPCGPDRDHPRRGRPIRDPADRDGSHLDRARASHRCRRRADLGSLGRLRRRERPFGPGVKAVTDSRGVFKLPSSPSNSILVGQVARLLIRLRDGTEREATAVPADDGSVTVKLPIPAGSLPRAIVASSASRALEPASTANHHC